MADTFKTKVEHELNADTNMEITSDHDVIKFLSTIHSPIKNDTAVSTDLKLAKFDKKEKRFINKQFDGAFIIRRMIQRAYGMAPAQGSFSGMTTTIQTMSILNQNDQSNFFLRATLARNLKDIEPVEDTKQGIGVPSKTKAKKSSKDDDDDEDDD